MVYYISSFYFEINIFFFSKFCNFILCSSIFDECIFGCDDFVVNFWIGCILLIVLEFLGCVIFIVGVIISMIIFCFEKLIVFGFLVNKG